VDWANRALPELARAYGVDVVADAYRHAPFPVPTAHAGAEIPLSEVLEGLVTPVAVCRYDRGIVQVRHRRWHVERAMEIPQRTASKWAERLRASGRFTLDQLCELSLELGDEQWDCFRVVMADEGLAISEFDWYQATRERPLIRAFGSLTAAQRERILAGRSITYAEMAPAARRWLALAVAVRDRETESPSYPIELPPAALSLAPQNVRSDPSAPSFEYLRSSGKWFFHVPLPRAVPAPR
jgi:hypothetical protein